MSFIADQQTLEDLNIPGRFKNNSVFRLFDQVCTNGGRKLLDDMFRHPLTQPDEINRRSDTFRYFGKKALTFPFVEDDFSVLEDYLGTQAGSSLPGVAASIIRKKIAAVITRGIAYSLLETALRQTITALCVFHDFIGPLLQDTDNPAREQLLAVYKIYGDKRLQSLLAARDKEKLTLWEVIRFDHLLRVSLREEMWVLTEFVFELDVNIAVSGVAVARGFCYATALQRTENVLHIGGLYHPSLRNAVPNNLAISQQSNVLFLTGANMAGKSTLMKSLGIAVYLAHIGFPIAAGSMEFSVKDGLFSSINVPDDLGHGYSHFYAEVLRVKKVAEAVSAGKDLIVIFDELFKGTNVKDAYDATLAITEAFSENRNCFFIIST
ncbi:MAG TPA: DNA mismatch repair protein, partial [Chitinophaga sp.]